MPACVMGPCLVESEGGVEYEWVDVNQDPADGCECRRVLGNTSHDPPELLGEPEPGLAYLDENCDGVDGVIGHALFVRAGAASGGDGSLMHPYPVISQALMALPASGKAYILVAEGSYDESIELRPGSELHGGYAADFLQRDVALYPSEILGVSPQYTVRAEGILSGSHVLLSGFVIQGMDVTETQPAGADGAPTTAIHLKDCDDAVVLRSNVINAGRGGDGGRGDSGEAGYGRQESLLLDGGDGLNGLRRNGDCPPNSSRPGGHAGFNQVCHDSDGNPGGTSICPVFDWNASPVQGAQAQYTSETDGNGLGGYDWSFDEMSGDWCSHATESGYPTDNQLNVGHDGRDGQDGTSGQGGEGGRQSYGSFLNDVWVAAPDGATGGTLGTDGGGGGGGGAGGGTAYWPFGGPADCQMHEIAPSGGGGGAGGCSGLGGMAGGAGGASVAILITGSSVVSGQPQLLHNRIQRATGGRGGDGGFGGMGGLGGHGGYGGNPPDWISSQGGKGGDGGNGGPGGGGGGGAGGPSYGALGFNVSTDGIEDQNTFVLAGEVLTGGPGGAGGVSVGTGASGESGVRGASSNVLGLVSCAGGGCPAGTACDGNGVCVPVD
jgi:hypothetical protein